VSDELLSVGVAWVVGKEGGGKEVLF